MRRAALIPLAASALLIAVAPVLSQQRRTAAAAAARGSSSGCRDSRQQPPAPPPQAAREALPSGCHHAAEAARRSELRRLPQADSARSPSARIAPALAKMIVAKDFFWLGEKGDRADKKRPGIDNLTRAMDLAAKDGSGWEALDRLCRRSDRHAVAGQEGHVLRAGRSGVRDQAAREPRQGNRHQRAEWGYPVQPGVEVRAAMQPNAPVIEKLGMHFVRVMEDDGPEPPPNQMPMLKVVAPSGKVGYVPGRRRQPAGQRSALLRQGRLGLEDRRLHRRRAVSQLIANAGARAGIARAPLLL